MNVIIRKMESELFSLGRPEVARTHAGWRKAGTGLRFFGVTKGDRRNLARQQSFLSLDLVWEMLTSDVLDMRSLGILMIVDRFQKGSPSFRSTLFDQVLAHRHLVNDWELVDDLSPPVIGAVSDGQWIPGVALLMDSPSFWDRRMAIVSTLFAVRKGDLDLAFRLSEQALPDGEPLIRKATGWVLRECGKKDLARLKSFLHEHIEKLSPVTLSYAVERFPREEQLRYRTLRKEKPFPGQWPGCREIRERNS